jgi:hypothetical protein
MFDTIFADGSLTDYISQNAQDPWVGTSFQGYVFMSPKQKGEFGERFVAKYFEAKNHQVKRAKTSTAGHDRVIDDIRTEIKFSLATRNKKGGVKEDQFIINHVSKDKDWERLVFFGINNTEEASRLFWFTKEDFLKHLESDGCLFAAQQGGKSIGNDDFICTKVNKLVECDFVKAIDEW